MKSIITISLIIVLSVLFCGCSQPENPAVEIKAALAAIDNEAATIQTELAENDVQPKETADVIGKSAGNIRKRTAKASGQVKVIVDENVKLEKENKRLKGITTLDWIIAGALTLGLIIAAVKISKVFWWAVPVPGFGLVLSQIVTAVLNNLGMILLVIGLFAALAVIAWIYAAFKGNVTAIEAIKKILPSELDGQLFGGVGESGLMGKVQPKSTQELVKKVKNR
jgi:hypothetical protein